MPMTILFCAAVALVLLHEIETSLAAYGFVDWREVARLPALRRVPVRLAGLLVLATLAVAEAGLADDGRGGVAETLLLVLIGYAAVAYRVIVLHEQRAAFGRQGLRRARAAIFGLGAGVLAAYAYAALGPLVG